MSFDLARFLWNGPLARYGRASTSTSGTRGRAVQGVGEFDRLAEVLLPEVAAHPVARTLSDQALSDQALSDRTLRVRLGGCLVDLVTESHLRRMVEEQFLAPADSGTWLVASANLDHITHFGGSPAGDAMDPGRMDDWLVLLDGAPMVRAAHRLTGVAYPRLAGSDLLPDLFDLAQEHGRSVAILGGRPEIREPLAEEVRRRWPGLRLLAHLTPSRAELLDPEESLRIETELATLRPDLLVVGLGKPLQERWMARHGRRTGARIVVAFGAAIDFVAGSVPRAPEWVRGHGLEWGYRLLREPRRMSRRYLLQGPPAMVSLRRDRQVVSVPPWGAGTFVPAGTGTPPAGSGTPPPSGDTTGSPLPEAQEDDHDRTRLRAPCTAVIVTYQSADHVGALLEALQAEREAGLDLDVLVVDNASTDGTPDVVRRFDRVRLVETGGNLGYAAGVNAGDRLVPPGHSLLVLNPDLVPTPGALGALLDGLDGPEVGIVLPRMADADGTPYPSLRNEPSVGRALVDALLGRRAARLPRWCSGMVWDPRAYRSEQHPDWATGAALLVSGACRSAVGEWDERYFLYSEETDFFRRARAAGFHVRYLPSALVRHLGGGSGTSDALYALCAVNAVRYYRRHHNRLAAAAFATVATLHQVLRARRPAARLALRALLLPSARSALPQPTRASASTE